MGYLITTLIILAIILGISIMANINLIKKNEKAEDMIIKRDEIIESFFKVIDFTNIKLNQIDQAGTFKSDDEIGFFFKQIKGLQEILNQFRISRN